MWTFECDPCTQSLYTIIYPIFLQTNKKKKKQILSGYMFNRSKILFTYLLTIIIVVVHANEMFLFRIPYLPLS